MGNAVSLGSKYGTTACGRCPITSRKPSWPLTIVSGSAARRSWRSAGTISWIAWVPMSRWSCEKADAAASRTLSSWSHSPKRTAGMRELKNSETTSLPAAAITSVRPRQTPRRRAGSSEERPTCNAGSSLGSTRSESFVTSSPRAWADACCRSSSSVLKPVSSWSVSATRMTRRARGAFEMIAFQTELDAERTPACTSFREM
mmetsp:Transcript_28165/g.56774  ORF Transcript_28165/g.56774 Transcript_28165/m.56774 type:complete len:202 (-) Transcript_28165:449-1054(-)